jgi:uncharacterized iron-regulated membrane protein
VASRASQFIGETFLIDMMRWHRLVVLLVGLLLAYMTITGTAIEIADMRVLIAHAPETDPDILLIRKHHNGPANYFVVTAPDYTAPALPASLDHEAAIQRAAQLGRAAAPGADLRLVELRSYAGKIAAHVQMNEHHMAFDLETGAPLPDSALPTPPLPATLTSPRFEFKALHRFSFLGPDAATVPNLVGGVGFMVLIVTGFIHYLRLFRQRRKIGKSSLFWRGGGGWWRILHRWAALLSIIVIVSLSITGSLMAINSFGSVLYWKLHPLHGAPSTTTGDFSTPLRDAELSAMTRATLSAFRNAEPGVGIKVLRLRYFAGYAQGIIVAADRDTTQLVYNIATGMKMSLSEKGYPYTDVLGWQWNQWLKQLHRGDIFGMSGRWIVTVSGFALVYMAISGLVLYYQAWMRRVRSGRRSLLWK